MTERNRISFIGREDELELIRRVITEQETRRVICIYGIGGIGKTRLLEEIHSRFGRDQDLDLRVTDVVDFDDRSLHVPEALQQQIMRRLNVGL